MLKKSHLCTIIIQFGSGKVTDNVSHGGGFSN